VLSLDENDAVKEAAEKAVLRIENDSLAVLARGLQDSSASVRSQCAQELADMGANAKPALPNLVDAMADNNSAVRVAVLYAFVSIGPDAIVVLGEALRDKNPQVRSIAVDALGRMGPDSRFVLNELIAVAFDTDVKAREEALTALARIGDSSVPQLVQALERERVDSRQQILVDALERIGRDSGPAVQVALQSAKPEVAKAMSPMLKKIAAQPVEPVAVATHTGEAALIQSTFADWFLAADTNKDGFLDKEELARAMRGPAAKPYDYRLPNQSPKQFGPVDFAMYPDYAFLYRVGRNDGRISRHQFERWAYSYAEVMRVDLESTARIRKAWAHAKERGLSEAQRRQREAAIAQMWAKYHHESRAHLFGFHRELVHKWAVARRGRA
jgi:HEAT repeat protein